MNSEYAFGVGALQIAARKKDGIASFDDLRREIPNFVTLDDEDRQVSTTRPNEELWEQRVRNLVSHRKTGSGIIAQGLATHLPKHGFQITGSGMKLLKLWKLI